MKLKVNAKLDPQFEPMSVVVREMREATKENGQDVIIAAVRNDEYTTVYRTRIYPEGTGHDEENFRFIERIAKSLVWVAGAYKLVIAGADTVGKRIKEERERLGLSVDDVAAALGKNRATVYRYESNEIVKLPTNILIPLAKVLKTTPAHLMGWESDSATGQAALSKEDKVSADNDPTIETYKKLNPLGKQKASDYIQDLSEQPKYIEPVSSEEPEMQLVADVKKSLPAIEEDETTIL